MELKKVIFIIFLSIAIIIGTIYLFNKMRNAGKEFVEKTIIGQVEWVGLNKNGFATISVDDTKYHLGTFLSQDCTEIIAAGDSIYKPKGTFKMSFYRNNEFVCESDFSGLTPND